jgi:diketogulonate reductase-like aldo/keto reductase
VFRWLQQRGICVLTKSTKTARAEANLAAAMSGEGPSPWALSAAEMDSMARLEADGRREIDPHAID